MGADLYIRDMDRAKQIRGFEVSWDAVKDGYFRDCYNDGGLFNFLRSNTGKEWSWWQLREKKSWFVNLPDTDGEDRTMMSTIGATKFLAMLKKAKIQIDKIDKPKLEVMDFDEADRLRKAGKLEIGGSYPKKIKELTDREIYEYKTWLDQLILFLELAIKIQSPIIWSV